MPYEELSFLACNSLIKSTWQFLSEHKMTLKHDLLVPNHRANDIPIM
jgi:hypothetical protein